MKDGSTAVGGDTEGWIQIFQIMSAQPQMYANFDMVRIFKHIARIMGAKDINEFILQQGPVSPVKASVNTTQNIEQGVQQGNMVPIEQYPGGVQ